MIYLKERHRKAFFNSFHEDLAKVGHRWTAYEQHGDLLRNLKEVGGFQFIPEEPRKKIMLWCMLAFVGEPGGYGTFGRNRRVFYSNTASPVIRELVKSYGQDGKPMLEVLAQLPEVVRATSDKHVAQRLQELLDVVS